MPDTLDTLFQHYIIGGGWTMFILIPASIVAVATIIRVVLHLTPRAAHSLADDLQKTVREQNRRATKSAISQQSLSLTDARTIAADYAMTIHSAMQPLTIIYAAAPVVGAIGSAWKLSIAWSGPDSLRDKNLSAAIEQAFVPLGWGLIIALIAITGYAGLRARLIKIEREILAPAAITALNESETQHDRR